jgi:hypothetical protein
LVAHHRNPEEKEGNVARMVNDGTGLKRFRQELEKCLCLCCNCHAKVHAGVETLCQ